MNRKSVLLPRSAVLPSFSSSRPAFSSSSRCLFSSSPMSSSSPPYSPLADYSSFFSAVSLRRFPSPIRALQPLVSVPGMISLGGGLPNPSLFPFSSLSFRVKGEDKEVQLEDKELAEALQYSPTPGLPSLLQSLRALQKREHLDGLKEKLQKLEAAASSASSASSSSPTLSSLVVARPDASWSLSVTTGSQDALSKAFETFLDPEDVVLVDFPTYSGALALLKPLGVEIKGVKSDKFGLDPEDLEHILRSYEEPKQEAKEALKEGQKGLRRSKRPRVLYTITTGQNPSGSTLTLERKRKILALASRFDLLVLEDDPYKYLEYGPERVEGKRLLEEGEGEEKEKGQKDQREIFQRPVNLSLFSLDKEGRVLRFDSFSKVLSSGLRLGFVTGPSALVEQINLVSQASSLHASGLSQMLAEKLLRQWGAQGWERHCQRVAFFYGQRRDRFEALCAKYLEGLADWDTPSAGMFLWLRLRGVQDSKQLIMQKAVDKKVLLLHGEAFHPDDSPSGWVRASFSTASDQQMETALQRLRDLLLEHRQNSQAK